jgi:hypothetical protein
MFGKLVQAYKPASSAFSLILIICFMIPQKAAIKNKGF